MHGEAFSLTGSGFTSRASPQPVFYWDGSTGTNGENPFPGSGPFPDAVYGSFYSNDRSGGTSGPTFTTANALTGNVSILCPHRPAGNSATQDIRHVFKSGEGLGFAITPGTKIVHSHIWRWQMLDNVSRNWKVWRCAGGSPNDQNGYRRWQLVLMPHEINNFEIDGMVADSADWENEIEGAWASWSDWEDTGEGGRYPAQNTWHNVTTWLHESSVDTANGALKVIWNGRDILPTQTAWSSFQTRASGGGLNADGGSYNDDDIDGWNTPHYWACDAADGWPANSGMDEYHGNIYVDNSWLQVVFGNNATLSSCTKLVFQPQTSRSTTQVDIICNKGNFTTGEDCYGWVVNAGGLADVVSLGLLGQWQ